MEQCTPPDITASHTANPSEIRITEPLHVTLTEVCSEASGKKTKRDLLKPLPTPAHTVDSCVFGGVTLVFSCYGVEKSLHCGSIVNLLDKTQTHAHTHTTKDQVTGISF